MNTTKKNKILDLLFGRSPLDVRGISECTGFSISVTKELLKSMYDDNILDRSRRKYKYIYKLKDNKININAIKDDNNFNIVTMSDWHVPFEDKNAIKIAMDAIQKIQPNIIIIHEIHDFYTLSRFDKNPARKDDLQNEIDGVQRYFDDIHNICPDTRLILLDSNHLDRLRRYLWGTATALQSLRSLQIPELLDLKLHNIEYMEDFIYNGVLFKHGEIVCQGSGATALRELQKENMNGVSGHTHRQAIVYRRDHNSNLFWMESGCLCTLRPEYIKGLPNWQSGISVVTWNENKNPIPRLIKGEN